MTSVVVPAHNEAEVIERTLIAVRSQVDGADQVVVVSNGSADNTVELARAFEPHVLVVDTARASKTAALNLGDQRTSSFPRIYLDADVELHQGTLAKIRHALANGPWLAVSPDPVMDLSASSWAVKAYYDVWLSLPYCRDGMIGAGCYALSEQGRKRFDRFPDVIADDGYVRALFQEHERGRVVGAHCTVRAPTNLSWLLKIKVRSRLGQMQLVMKFPELIRNQHKAYGSGIFTALRNPLKWPAAAVYLYVNLASRLLARRKIRALAEYKWEKDVSSRERPSERAP